MSDLTHGLSSSSGSDDSSSTGEALPGELRQRGNAWLGRVKITRKRILLPQQGGDGGDAQPLQPKAQIKTGVPDKPSRLRELLQPKYLKDLRKVVNRGELDLKFAKIGKGMGEFEAVADAAELAMKKDPFDLADVRALIDTIDRYCTPEREQSMQKELSKGRKGDQKTVKKYYALENLKREAEKLLQDPIDDRFHQNRLDTPQDRELAHRQRAEDLEQAFGKVKAASGTSDVQLIKDCHGAVAYAFKSVAGEPDAYGMKKGSGAVREAMASAMSNAILQLTGLDLAFPQVSMVDLNGAKGALVEGLSGVSHDPNWKAGKVRSQLGDDPGLVYKRNYATPELYAEAQARKKQYDEESDRLLKELEPERLQREAKASAMARQLPGKELQKVLLCSYAMTQFDIKWDNMMMTVDGGGRVGARPFDAGAGFLDDSMLAEKDDLLDAGPKAAGFILLKDPIDQTTPLPGALDPIDQEMRQQFLDINLAQLKRTLEAERTRLARTHGLGSDVLSDKSMLRSYRSVAILKEILADARVRTTADLVQAFTDRMAELKDPA